MTLLITIVVYFAVVFLVSRLASRGGNEGNEAFFRAGRQSPWPVVAFGMVGASLSGVTFISVPGMVLNSDMTYLQMCMGFIVGYLIVAFVLLPLYYKYNLTSIYSYLGERFGATERKTGSLFFIISKIVGAAARLYLVCVILQQFAFPSVPFFVVVLLTLVLIWLYTHRSGIRALVWTDALQTFCLLAALVLIIIKASSMLDFTIGEAITKVWNDSHSRIFEWQDWSSTQHFVKQFLSGIFIVIVMTGLDQDTMQKNLTCRTLRDGQKDLCSYGLLFLPVNFLFLALGVLMYCLYIRDGLLIPDKGDSLLPNYIVTGEMGQMVLICFAVGIIASAFSSADSALTALTTSVCIDVLEIENGKRDENSRERLRRCVHIGVTLVFVLLILVFKAIGSGSVIDTIYTLAGYTYGPLLGLFAFGMTTKRQLHGGLVPVVAIAAPVLCYFANELAQRFYGYHFGYEMLMLNGLLTYLGLWTICRNSANRSAQRSPSMPAETMPPA